jgi:hypothetical protein
LYSVSELSITYAYATYIASVYDVDDRIKAKLKVGDVKISEGKGGEE